MWYFILFNQMNCVRKWRIWWYSIIFSFHIEEDAQVKKKIISRCGIQLLSLWYLELTFLRMGASMFTGETVLLWGLQRKGTGFVTGEMASVIFWRQDTQSAMSHLKKTFCTLSTISLLLFKNPFTISSMIANADMILNSKYSKISQKNQIAYF